MPTPKFTPRIITGAWRQGFALDLHTISSVFAGHDEHGHARFETTRSEVGELLYLLKNKGDKTAIDPLTDAAESFLREWKPAVDILVPVPPSTNRPTPPVMVLAEAISKRLALPLANCVTRMRDIPQLKNVSDLDQRAKLLDGLHAVDKSASQGKSILLFDDLYRSGATMNAIAAELRDKGAAADLFAFTITRTRSNQ
jgi:competence protein ComFC